MMKSCIIIKYLPSDAQRNHLLTATLYDIYNLEEWLNLHTNVEDIIFMPAVKLLESNLRNKADDVSARISNIIDQQAETTEMLSDREKDVIVGVVQGLTNKEIADKLFISPNTVITHRRNIAKKLQIHTAAGLTIYAVVNKLVDLSKVDL